MADIELAKDTLIPVPESISQKVGRELSLLGNGISAGFGARANQAAENIGLTALEITGSAAIGAGLTALHELGGRYAGAAKLGGIFLGGLAVGDVARRVIPTVGAMQDNWNNPQNYEANKAVVASNIGSAAFDYPLMAMSGLAGAGLTRGVFAEIRASESPVMVFRSNRYGNASEPIGGSELRNPVYIKPAQDTPGRPDLFQLPASFKAFDARSLFVEKSLLETRPHFMPIIPLPISGLYEKLKN